MTHWNKACETLTGQPASAIVGTKNYPQALYDNKNSSIVDLLLGNVLQKRTQIYDGATYTQSTVAEDAYETVRFFSNLGTRGKWLMGTALLLKDESGKIVGAIETWQDLSSYRSIERKRNQHKKMEALGTLSGHIAHDFNNILSAVIGYADVSLLHLPGESPARRSVNRVIDAAIRAQDLIGQIYTFSSSKKAKGRPFQVGKIMQKTLQSFAGSLPENINILEDIRSEALVMGDDKQFQQVLTNLYTNASQAMADNGGTLTIRLTEVKLENDPSAAYSSIKPGLHLKLTIKDTGPGIAPEILEHVFEPFFTTRKKGEGTGMGLATVYGIVTSYGGKIDCISQLGDGATFNIYLPIITRTNEG